MYALQAPNVLGVLCHPSNRKGEKRSTHPKLLIIYRQRVKVTVKKLFFTQETKVVKGVIFGWVCCCCCFLFGWS